MLDVNFCKKIINLHSENPRKSKTLAKKQTYL